MQFARATLPLLPSRDSQMKIWDTLSFCTASQILYNNIQKTAMLCRARNVVYYIYEILMHTFFSELEKNKVKAGTYMPTNS